ncbi:MAG: response regulator receiver protein [Verrucomicrobiales bacterium]|nr:response regulator receiver protein [Verrucomicrobiales bacterium]
MTREVVILIADDDAGHSRLIEKNLRRVGINNSILCFENGQDILDYLFVKTTAPIRTPDDSYLLLLDIRMPKVDGVEVLRQIKADQNLRRLPVTMLTTTDDPRDVALCHELGCSSYIVKPVDHEKFSEAIKHLGLFMTLVQVPKLDSSAER